jgi:hypothetical protein
MHRINKSYSELFAPPPSQLLGLFFLQTAELLPQLKIASLKRHALAGQAQTSRTQLLLADYRN